MWSGFTLGVALIFLNPAALVTWVVIVGSYLGDVTNLEGGAATIGIAVGSMAWFALVAYLANHGRKLGKAMWLTRVVGVLLVGYGVFSLGKAAKYWFF
jgi:arginine exporter protein ArgO